jgi:hypothetical protein
MNSLENLREAARRAYSGTSFSPEKRADAVVRDYSQELDEDIEKIKSLGAGSEQVERYRKGYEDKISKWLYSQSNVMSSMITGPARFPTERNRKRSNWADGHYNTFRQWREKVLDAYDRHEKKRKIEAAGGEIGIARQNLEYHTNLQERYKKINDAYRKFKKNPISLEESDLDEKSKEMIRTWVPAYSFEKAPILSYMLTNNNARIKYYQERVQILENKESAAMQAPTEMAFEGGKVKLNAEIDRLQILFDAKPEPEMIAKLKKNGFRWSPYYKAWQRQLTGNAKFAARIVLGDDASKLY